MNYLLKAFDVQHGQIKATGYVMDKIAYFSDCNYIPKKSLNFLKSKLFDT